MLNFNSVIELSEAVKALGENGGKSNTYGRPENSGFSFSGAVEAGLAGGLWPEGAENLHKTILAGEFSSQQLRTQLITDVQGFSPIVPHAVMGLPNAMLNRVRVNAPKKVMRIGVNVGRQACCDDAGVLRRGKAILSVIDALETQGYQTEVIAFWRNAGGGQTADITCIVKNTNESPNLSSLAFVFCSWAFQRRLCWRLAEKHYKTVVKCKYGNGLGCYIGDFDLAFTYMMDDEWCSPDAARWSTLKVLRNINFEVVV